MGFFGKNFGKNNKEEYYEEIPNDFDDYDDEYGDEDDYYYEEEQPAKQETYSPEPSITSRRKAAPQRESKVVSMNDNRSNTVADRDMKMVIFKPSSYDETESVIDSLRARKPIVVNLDEINPAVAQRILDFISGAVYALNGDIRRAARNIFVVAPSNIEIASSGIEDDSVTNGEL